MKLRGSAILILVAMALVTCAPAPEQVAVEEPDAAKADTGIISAGEFELDYFIEGTGTPTIVIGFPNYYRRAFSQNLRSHLRLVFLDHRGTAPSPGPVGTEEYALERLIDDIELARQTLELGRIAVIGHSGNSYLALEYGKKYPEHTSHVVMIGISPDLSDGSIELADKEYEKLADSDRLAAEQENLQALPDEELEMLLPEEAFIRSYIRNAARVWYDPRFDCTPLWEDVTINMDMFEHVWGKLFVEIDVTKGLELFDRPVFLAVGRYDFIVAPPSSWDPIIPAFQNLTIRIFEKSGHTPQLEEPELFDQELLAWMKDHST